MKIEDGKFYRTRNGRKIGPMRVPPGEYWASDVAASDGKQGWYEGGFFWRGEKTNNDLIAEWVDTPDYNDGKWHGWNGGECPVDPDSEIEVRWANPQESRVNHSGLACRWDSRCWHNISPFGRIIAFRVTKPAPPQPRDFWLRFDMNGTLPVVYATPTEPTTAEGFVIHVREVTE